MNATQTTAMKCDKPRGFKGVPCIKCMETDCVRVNLDDVNVFVCSSCDEEFGSDDVEAFVSAWGKVLAWVQSAPVTE